METTATPNNRNTSRDNFSHTLVVVSIFEIDDHPRLGRSLTVSSCVIDKDTVAARLFPPEIHAANRNGFRPRHSPPWRTKAGQPHREVELFHRLGFFIPGCERVSYGRFKRSDVYIL